MKKLIVDRFDGIYAICRDNDKRYYAIEISELPAGLSVGSVLEVDDEAGTITAEGKK